MNLINLTKNDIERLGVFSTFNKLRFIFLGVGKTHVMRSGSLNMVKVNLDANIPAEFGTTYSKLLTLNNLSESSNQHTSLEVVESKHTPSVYLKCRTAYNEVQIPTEPRKYLTDYLPKNENSFAEFAQKVKDNEICNIVASKENPSLFERFDYTKCAALKIENESIDIYVDDRTGNINIEISQKSVNEGALPSGAKSKVRQENDNFVKSIVCMRDDIIGHFPDNLSFSIPASIYATMQSSKRQFDMRMGTFELADRTWLGLHFYCDDIEFFNILESKNKGSA